MIRSTTKNQYQWHRRWRRSKDQIRVRGKRNYLFWGKNKKFIFFFCSKNSRHYIGQLLVKGSKRKLVPTKHCVKTDHYISTCRNSSHRYFWEIFTLNQLFLKNEKLEEEGRWTLFGTPISITSIERYSQFRTDLFGPGCLRFTFRSPGDPDTAVTHHWNSKERTDKQMTDNEVSLFGTETN